MDPATERAIEALATAISEFVEACVQMAVAVGEAFESLGASFAAIGANAYAAQVQGRGPDVDAEWRRLAETWTTRY